jgi:hypothetical protein
VLLVALTACGPSAHVIEAPVARGGDLAAASARAQAEALWAERGSETGLRAALAAYTRAVAEHDDDARAWLGLAHAEFFLADGTLAFDPAAREEMARTFEDGAAHAERGLRALSPDFEARRRAGADVDQAALGLEARVDRRVLAELLYFWGQNLIRWADLRGRFAAMKVYQSVNRAVQATARLDPTVDRGGPDRFLGSFYAEAPGIAGGDLDKSRAAFERALAIAPDDPETLVAQARYYARRAHDPALYRACLAKIADAVAAAPPEARPEAAVAKRKAQALPADL